MFKEKSAAEDSQYSLVEYVAVIHIKINVRAVCQFF